MPESFPEFYFRKSPSPSLSLIATAIVGNLQHDDSEDREANGDCVGAFRKGIVPNYFIRIILVKLNKEKTEHCTFVYLRAK